MKRQDNHSGRWPMGPVGRWATVSVLTLVAGALGWQLLLGAAPAEAQTSARPLTKARPAVGGLLAVPAQISKDQFGLYLIDAANGTMSVYRYQNRDRTLRLLASRTFIYDLQLDSYNTKPLPKEVQKMVADARRLESVEPRP